MGDKKTVYALENGILLQDRYRIDAVLGSNGISITYCAYDTFREKKIVIKELFPQDVVERNKDDHCFVNCLKLIYEQDFTQMKEHMMKEARTLIQLFPLDAVTNVITFFEENGTVYIVMEFAEGISIEEYLEKNHRRKISLTDAVQLLSPVMLTLDKVHKKGVVHGKINPSLILITEEKKAVLLGFGDPMEDASLDMAENTTARVPGYAPVEQYVKQGGYGPTVDLYAMAAVLYELCTDKKVPPFYERINALEAKKEDPLKNPVTYDGTIMDYQANALMKALSIYHFDRFESMKQFWDAIAVQEPMVDDAVIRTRHKPVAFAQKEKYYKWLYGVAAVCILFLLFFFVPRMKAYVIGLEADSFYEKLEAGTAYEKCLMIDQLPVSKRRTIANDYTAMKEDEEHEIHYYDKVTKRLVNRKELALSAELVRFISLDYRKGNRAILTFYEDGVSHRMEIDLKEEESGSYSYKETTNGGTSGL